MNDDRSELYARRDEIDAVLNKRSTGIFASIPSEAECFYEGVYCLCAVQNPSARTEKAVEWLKECDLFGGGMDVEVLADGLRQFVRFHRTKAARILWFRNQISQIRARLLSNEDVSSLRNWLATEVNGFSFKEASHFMRNIGFRGLAILDIHILRRLSGLGLITWDGGALTQKAYMAAEAAMRSYADSLNTDIDHLDVLWWSDGAGRMGR